MSPEINTETPRNHISNEINKTKMIYFVAKERDRVHIGRLSHFEADNI